MPFAGRRMTPARRSVISPQVNISLEPKRPLANGVRPPSRAISSRQRSMPSAAAACVNCAFATWRWASQCATESPSEPMPSCRVPPSLTSAATRTPRACSAGSIGGHGTPNSSCSCAGSSTSTSKKLSATSASPGMNGRLRLTSAATTQGLPLARMPATTSPVRSGLQLRLYLPPRSLTMRSTAFNPRASTSRAAGV